MPADTETPPEADESFWQKIPQLWKAVGVMLGIAAAAIAGYDRLDSVRDDLVANDDSFKAGISQLGEADSNLADRIAKLSDRLDAMDASMLSLEDLKPYVASDALAAKLKTQACRQGVRAQMHEYRALEKAYEELLQTVNVSELAFAGRELTDVEQRQADRVNELRGLFQKKQWEMAGEAATREERLDTTEEC